MRNLSASSRRTGNWLLLGTLVICTGVLGGCCSVGDHAILMTDIPGEAPTGDETEKAQEPTCCPGEDIVLEVWAGQTISFVNATDRECTVKANAGVYTKNNVFTIAPHTSVKRKVADLDIGKEISNDIKCEEGDHGTPRMIIVENPNSED